MEESTRRRRASDYAIRGSRMGGDRMGSQSEMELHHVYGEMGNLKGRVQNLETGVQQILQEVRQLNKPHPVDPAKWLGVGFSVVATLALLLGGMYAILNQSQTHMADRMTSGFQTMLEMQESMSERMQKFEELKAETHFEVGTFRKNDEFARYERTELWDSVHSLEKENKHSMADRATINEELKNNEAIRVWLVARVDKHDDLISSIVQRISELEAQSKQMQVVQERNIDVIKRISGFAAE